MKKINLQFCFALLVLIVFNNCTWASTTDEFVFVSSAGSAKANQAFQLKNGSYYNVLDCNSDPDFNQSYQIVKNGSQWEIKNESGTVLYNNTHNTPTPPDVDWQLSNGTAPAPNLSGKVSTVTPSPPIGPIQNFTFSSVTTNSAQVNILGSAPGSLAADYQFKISGEGHSYRVFIDSNSLYPHARIFFSYIGYTTSSTYSYHPDSLFNLNADLSGLCPSSNYTVEFNNTNKSFTTSNTSTRSISGDTSYNVGGNLTFNVNQITTILSNPCGDLVWQVNKNDGSGFVNLTNDANHSGYNNKTLNISNIPASFHNYQYRAIVDYDAKTDTTNIKTIALPPSAFTKLKKIERYNPLQSSTTNKSLEFKVTFSDTVSHVDATDFLPAGPIANACQIDNVTLETDSTYIVFLSTTSANNGEIGLNLKGVDTTGTNNIESAGVQLGTELPSVDETYQYQACDLVATYTSTNVLCKDSLTASIDVSVSGGTNPLTFTWNGRIATEDRTNLSAGSYSVTITDDNACADTLSMVITEPTAISTSISVVKNASCETTADGELSVQASGGIDNNYTYTWSSGSTTASATSLFYGKHYVTVTNNAGCQKVDSVNIVVVDTIKPTFTTQSPTFYLDGFGAGSIKSSDLYSSVNDNCGIQSVVEDTFYVDCSHIGSNQVMLYATDVHNNLDSAMASFTVIDTTKPNAFAGNPTLYLDQSGNASITANQLSNRSDDNCTINTLTIDKSNFDCSHLGQNQVILTVIDDSGNEDKDTTTINILDTIKPTVVTQNITLYLDGAGQASITANDIDAGSTDNCAIQSLSLSKTNFVCSEVGSNTVTLTVTDSSNNVNSAQAIVTLVDSIKPTVVTQSIDVYLDANGEFTIQAIDVDGGSSDNCGSVSLSIDSSHFDCSEIGANTVTLTATDLNNNVSTALATVNVHDTTRPVVQTQNINLYLDANGFASITTSNIDNGSADNCAIQSMSLSKTNFNCSEVGQNTVTLTITDVNGNSNSNSAIVTVVDSLKPVFGLQHRTAYLDQNGAASMKSSDLYHSISDNCGIQSIVEDTTYYDCNDLGANTFAIYATDVNNNLDSAFSTVIVVDTLSPQMLTQDVTVYLNALGEAIINPAQIDNGSSDNCGIFSMTLDSTHFDCSEIGTNSVVLSAIDLNGRKSAKSATVTVLDTNRPVVVTRNIDIYLDQNGEASISTTDINKGSSDNCGIATMVLDSTSFDCSEVGLNTVTLKVTDVNGNVDSATAIVTVIDTLRPVVLAQNINLYLDANGLASTTSNDVDNGSSDNCGIQNSSISQSSFDCSHVGPNNITYRIMDVNGNQDSVTVVVSVIDTVKPTVLTHDTTIYLDQNGAISITEADVNNGSYSNCTIQSIRLDSTQFDCSEVRTNTVWLTVTDIYNNVDSASAVVTVLDTNRPVVITQNIDIYLDQNGEASISTTDINNGSSDNCGIATVVLDSTSFDCSEVGLNTVTLTVTDVNGNVDSATSIVTVIDTLRPVVLAQNIDLYLDANGLASITTNDVDNGSSDNCGIQNSSLSQSSFDCSHVGPNNITYRIMDVNGNQDSVTVVVSVIDTVRPTVLTHDTTIYLDQNGAISITEADVNNGSYSNCTIQSISLDSTQFDCSEVGTNTVWLTVTDIYNNVDSASAVVTVLDTTSPTPLVRDTTLYLDQSGTALITASMLDDGSSDNCGIQSSELINSTIDCNSLGNNNLYLKVIDVNGNVDSALSQVLVLDTIKPQISSCPSDFVVSTDMGNCTAIVNWTLPTATDNCTLDSLVSNFPSGTAFPIGVTTVTYIAYDQSLNTDTCQFTITVSDQEKPLISNVPADIVVANDSANCSALVTWVVSTATDNCGIDSLVSNFNSGDTFPLGITTVSYIAYDAALNTDTVTFTISVEDREKPSLVCRADTIVCDQAVVYNMPTAYDNCPGVVVNQIAGLSSGSIFPYGTTENVFVAIDGSGNTDTCSFFVTVYETPTAANAGNDTNICLPTISLYANSAQAGVGEWTALDNSISFADSFLSNTDVFGLQRGNNVLIWTISNGICSPSMDTVIVTFDSEPSDAVAGDDFVVCDEVTTTLTAVSPTVGLGTWSVLNSTGSIANVNQADAIIDNLNKGWNNLMWTTSNGTCNDRFDTLRIKAVDSPVAIASNDTAVFKDDGVQLHVRTDSSIASYLWTPSHSLNFSNIQSPFARPEETTEYMVEVTTADGCTGSDYVQISINGYITIPTAFTPNNDGVNDTWDIKNTEEFVKVEVAVYDNFGKELLSTGNYIPWDGKYQGNELPVGSYYYSVIMKRHDGTESIKTGIVSILR